VDAGDAWRRLDELRALADYPAALRDAIGELDREAIDELAVVAVQQVASLEAADFGVAEAGEREDDELQADGDAEDEELAIDDPWVDPERPHSSKLDGARQLRMALLDQPDLSALFNAVGALSAEECALIVLELAFDGWCTRRLEGGAGGERGDGGDR
jgi:hypothetical protein